MVDKIQSKQDTIHIDAKGKSLGRVASDVARYLQGKHMPSYRPHIPASTRVVVSNITLSKVDTKALDRKVYYHSSLRPGGLKEVTFKEKFASNPQEVFRNMVRRMIPKNKLSKIILKHLQIT
ncbi:50S ribosomal protein L13 [Patescibacteria group bacterium]